VRRDLKYVNCDCISALSDCRTSVCLDVDGLDLDRNTDTHRGLDWVSEFVVWVVQEAGASIQIAAETLVNSTERLVVVSGSVDAVTRAIFHISEVMIQVCHRSSLHAAVDGQSRIFS